MRRVDARNSASDLVGVGMVIAIGVMLGEDGRWML